MLIVIELKQEQNSFYKCYNCRSDYSEKCKHMFYAENTFSVGKNTPNCSHRTFKMRIFTRWYVTWQIFLDFSQFFVKMEKWKEKNRQPVGTTILFMLICVYKGVKNRTNRTCDQHYIRLYRCIVAFGVQIKLFLLFLRYRIQILTFGTITVAHPRCGVVRYFCILFYLLHWIVYIFPLIFYRRVIFKLGLWFYLPKGNFTISHLGGAQEFYRLDLITTKHGRNYKK